MLSSRTGEGSELRREPADPGWPGKNDHKTEVPVLAVFSIQVHQSLTSVDPSCERHVIHLPFDENTHNSARYSI